MKKIHNIKRGLGFSVISIFSFILVFSLFIPGFVSAQNYIQESFNNPPPGTVQVGGDSNYNFINPPAGTVGFGGGTSGGISGSNIYACGMIANHGLPALFNCISGIFSYVVVLIVSLAVVYIIWGAFNMMREEKRQEGKDTVMYGIIGLFVMISVWGLVAILSNTFGLSDTPASTPTVLLPASQTR